ncbi:MAG: FG-GAP repeat domain-containing protein [Vicinamibacteria bacterium]
MLPKSFSPALMVAAAFLVFGCEESAPPGDVSTGDAAQGDRIDFLEKVPIGDPPGESPPWITHLQIVDLDEDGLPDVILTDATLNQVRWIRQGPEGSFEERPLGEVVIAPAHVSASDVDGDGDLDLLVAEMGQILPSNAKIGSVVVLENRGDETFESRVLLENVARVTDVESGDFDADGDIDLVVGQFGYDDGEIRWLRNLGGWRFESQQLLSLPGTIHVPVADMDGDGDLDIAAVVSQTWERVYVFENDGSGAFTSHVAYGATNEDFGSSGIALVDLDGDSDVDVLYTNGDAFDYVPSLPRPWHGVQWLENRGGLEFAYQRIGDFPGAYSARAADADGDSDLDVFAVSLFADWNDPASRSIVGFENDGAQGFTRRDIDSSPTHLVILDAGDLDGDGRVDLVTGGLYSHEPFDRMGRVTWWRNLREGR